MTYESGVAVVTFGKPEHADSLSRYGYAKAEQHIGERDEVRKKQVFAVEVTGQALDPDYLDSLPLTDDCRGMLQHLFIEAMGFS